MPAMPSTRSTAMRVDECPVVTVAVRGSASSSYARMDEDGTTARTEEEDSEEADDICGASATGTDMRMSRSHASANASYCPWDIVSTGSDSGTDGELLLLLLLLSR